MAEFRVTPQTLNSKAQELQKLNSQYKNALETLQQQEGALRGQWEGDAHDAFENAFKTDMNKLTTFYAAIEDYVQKLNMIAQEYAKAEQKNFNTASTRKA